MLQLEARRAMKVVGDVVSSPNGYRCSSRQELPRGRPAQVLRNLKVVIEDTTRACEGAVLIRASSSQLEWRNGPLRMGWH